MSELNHCVLCGNKPTLETKLSGKITVYRYTCNHKLCAGHHGMYYLVKGGAKRVWNAGQISKASVIRRFMQTEIVNGRLAK